MLLELSWFKYLAKKIKKPHYYFILKIAVNTRLLLHERLEGIGRFTYEILKRMVRQHPEVEFHFLFDRKFHPEFIFADNVIPHVIFPPSRHPILWYWWFEMAVPESLNRIKPDLFVSMDAFLSFRTSVKTHLTIHDLSFEHYPKAVPWLAQQYYKSFTPIYARKADRIATVSQFSKFDIIEHYKIGDSKIDVIPNAASDYFQPITHDQKLSIKSKYSSGEDFFICVSSLHPRKNIINLLKSFEIYKQQSKLKTKLLLIGEFMFSSGAIKQQLASMSSKDEVLFLGNCPHEQIAEILGAASAMVYISLFEGFGIPILEAMQSGVPVITSDCSSMPEVAGQAAVLVDPLDNVQTANAMWQVMTNIDFKNALIDAGFKNAKHYSWDNSAYLFWQSILKSL